MKNILIAVVCLFAITACSKTLTEQELITANQICQNQSMSVKSISKSGERHYTVYELTCKVDRRTE